MYSAPEIKSELLTLIGWRQNPDATGTQLTGLLNSDSGLYFNDVHPLLTFDNLESIAPQFTGFDFTAWLQEKTEAGIIAAVEDWIRAKFEVRTAKSLLESERLFDTTKLTTYEDNNDGRLAGLEIIPPRVRGVKARIEMIGLQFSQAQSITIRLYKSGSQAYVNTTTITYSTANALQWEAVNWELEGDNGYYLVYEQSALSGVSINGIRDYHAGLAPSLGAVPNTYSVGRYLFITPFSNPGSFGSIDPASNAYTIGTNYGLNLEFNAWCDYTAFVIRHKDILKSLIQKRVAMNMLREMAYNPNTRVNRHESNANIQNILYEIDGDSQGRPGGLKMEYQNELKATMMDQNEIDPICAPCRRRAVRYKAI